MLQTYDIEQQREIAASAASESERQSAQDILRAWKETQAFYASVGEKR
jgi:hypothetical protein